MQMDPEHERRLISGRAFLLGGVGVVLIVASLAFLWVLRSDTPRVDPTFWGTPTPTPEHAGLPF